MAAAEVQALLRFLTQDAKIPLAEAMPKVGALRKQELHTPAAIAGADAAVVHNIFVDDKLVKQVTNAAKRVANPKKRTASQSGPSPGKRVKTDAHAAAHASEAELALPTTELSIEDLGHAQVETNRAPLVLAFAVVVLEFTMPDQPLSSRLSLAQALVSTNSQTKAKSIGILSGTTAEDDGWAEGQPKVRILGRDIAVMRRHIPVAVQDEDSQDTVRAEDTSSHEAFWGLDLEALRKSNGPLVAGKLTASQGPPIHSAQAARTYLLKSVSPVQSDSTAKDSVTSPRKNKSAAAAATAAAKERAAAMLLQSIRTLCESWASTLSAADLDKRAWSWYLSVRPEVAQGQSGWGQRGRVELADILKLRRKT